MVFRIWKKFCLNGQVNLNNTCNFCQNLCKVCKSLNGCDECIENSYYIKNSCTCKIGLFKSNRKCLMKIFNASLRANIKNNLLLEFTEKTLCTLSKQDFELKIPGIDFDYLSRIEYKIKYKFIIVYKDFIYNDVKVSLRILNESIRSDADSLLLNFNHSENLNKAERRAKH